MNRIVRGLYLHLRLAAASFGVAIGVLALSGCEDERIQAYTAPKDPPRATANAADGGTGGGIATQTGEPGFTWNIPQGWRPAEDPPGFVLAAYDAGEGDATAQTTVSQLPGAGGGPLMNINRWRQQIGLEPVGELEEQPITRLDLDEHVAALVDLVSDDIRILAVIYPRQDRNQTWFFKMTGPPDTVEQQSQALLELVRSVQPKEADQ